MNLSLVIPCYNDEEVVPTTVAELRRLLDECKAEGLVGDNNEIVLVDDGSGDRTWPRIVEASEGDGLVRGIRLSRNRGHQNALLAGLDEAVGDFVVTMDSDLQDDISCVKDMLREARNGVDIVFGVRKTRDVDTRFNRLTANGFYKTMDVLGVEIVPYHADFRGMSRQAVDALLQFREVNLFLRGMVTQLGFKTAAVSYDRKPRLAGASSYSLGRRMALAWQGITSCSIIPLRIVTLLGIVFSCLSFMVGVWVLVVHFADLARVPGWASTVLPLAFFSGLQLLSLGVFGEYMGKIYLETKARPRYFVSEKTNTN
ncbi:MAG: glycosyltransferase family 2 protein [Deltaproteobacteria bacterium]|nr:glycosyltransferase family 2 protein [Deltaproteobacteria bacterium]